jgi:hypothetical protein
MCRVRLIGLLGVRSGGLVMILGNILICDIHGCNAIL